MTDWYSHDVDGRKRRAARKSVEGQRARVVARRAWLAHHHAEVTVTEAADRFGVTPATILADEAALGVRCQRPHKTIEPRKVRAESRERPDLLAGVREVARMMRAWR